MEAVVFQAKTKPEHDTDVKAWSTLDSDLGAEWQGIKYAVETYWKAAGDKSNDKSVPYAESFMARADARQKVPAEKASQIT
ncbi:hypothetical protein Z949_1089 [Sulfitobacter guttiformis KCTC 32187]|nr:hypothetical protein Z949_1089 [Sulfitobacter guttiformis KCTC 32187]